MARAAAAMLTLDQLRDVVMLLTLAGAILLIIVEAARITREAKESE